MPNDLAQRGIVVRWRLNHLNASEPYLNIVYKPKHSQVPGGRRRRHDRQRGELLLGGGLI